MQHQRKGLIDGIVGAVAVEKFRLGKAAGAPTYEVPNAVQIPGGGSGQSFKSLLGVGQLTSSHYRRFSLNLVCQRLVAGYLAHVYVVDLSRLQEPLSIA